MNRYSSIALAAVLSLALGAAFAQSTASQASAAQAQGSPLERLETLEKRVVELEKEITSLKSAKQSAGSDATDPAVKDQRRQLDEVLAYIAAQSESAKRLQEVLADSEQKGFTFGINPDSRIVMLAGLRDFTSTLQSNVPGSAAPAAKAQGVQR
jgi:hypothetical protein